MEKTAVDCNRKNLISTLLCTPSLSKVGANLNLFKIVVILRL